MRLMERSEKGVPLLDECRRSAEEIPVHVLPPKFSPESCRKTLQSARISEALALSGEISNENSPMSISGVTHLSAFRPREYISPWNELNQKESIRKHEKFIGLWLSDTGHRNLLKQCVLSGLNASVLLRHSMMGVDDVQLKPPDA